MTGLYNTRDRPEKVEETSQNSKKAALTGGKSDLGRHLVDIFEMGESSILQALGPQRFAGLFW